MEEEARLILREAVWREPEPENLARFIQNLANIIHDHFGPSKGVDLELPPREPTREPPRFD